MKFHTDDKIKAMDFKTLLSYFFRYKMTKADELQGQVELGIQRQEQIKELERQLKILSGIRCARDHVINDLNRSQDKLETANKDISELNALIVQMVKEKNKS